MAHQAPILERLTIEVECVCIAKRTDGSDCHRFTSHGDMCPQHARQILGVEVGQSTIVGAGLGLFVTRAFPRGHVLCEYKGRVVSRETWAVHPSAYGVRLYNGNTIDAVRSCDGFGRYANAGATKRLQNGHLVSGRQLDQRRGSGKQIYLQLTKAVREGDEVLISYGDSYFRDRLPPNRAG